MNETFGDVVITAEYGRRVIIPASTVSEWLDDLLETVDVVMSQPLRVGDDNHAGLSRFAFCAPEMIRGAITCEILRDKAGAL